MRNRNRFKTWLRWRRLKKDCLFESCYHAMHGVSNWREYYWRFYQRLKQL